MQTTIRPSHWKIVLRAALAGCLCAMMFIGEAKAFFNPAPQLVQDIKAEAQLVKLHATTMKEWGENFQHMQNIIDRAQKTINQIQRTNSLLDVLRLVEVESNENVAEALKLFDQIWKLQKSVRTLIQSSVAAIRSTENRLRNGIFNKDAALRDIEAYIRETLGRSSQNILLNQEDMSSMDTDLKRLIEREIDLEFTISALEKEIADLEASLDKLRKDMAAAPENAKATFKERIAITVKRVDELKTRLQFARKDLEEVRLFIWKRAQELQITVEKAHELARNYIDLTETYREFENARNEVAEELDRENYRNAQVEPGADDVLDNFWTGIGEGDGK